MYFLQMTRSMEHTEEEDNDEGGGREEVTNEQLVKGGGLTCVQCVFLCNTQYNTQCQKI